MRRRRPRLGHHQHAGGVAIEPVHQPRRLALLVGQALEQPVHVPLGAAAALAGKARRLVEDIELVVLVEDQPAQEIRVLGVDLLLDPLHFRLERRNPHQLSGGKPRAGLGPAGIDPHLPGPDQFFADGRTSLPGNAPRTSGRAASRLRRGRRPVAAPRSRRTPHQQQPAVERRDTDNHRYQDIEQRRSDLAALQHRNRVQ